MEFNVNVPNPIDGSVIKVTLFITTYLVTGPDGSQVLNVTANGCHDFNNV
jgi:hypothetical protein